MTTMSDSMVVNMILNDSKFIQGMEKAAYTAMQNARIQEREARKAAKSHEKAFGDIRKAADDAAKASERAASQFGMTAKQQTAAMRQVPAQFTDIVVSLQGGQAPLTVLLQQGGQLSDVFGGAANAARVLGSYVIGLVANPVVAVAAAVAALAYGFYRAGEETKALNKAIQMTGNVTGASVDDLTGYAERLDGTFGITQGKATESLAVIASTGAVSRDRLQEFTRTAINMEKQFGVSVDDVAKNFKKLGEEPVKGAQELNKALNFLTPSTYAQIIAAEKMGRADVAAAIAQDAYKKGMDARTENVVANAGYMERAFNEVTSAAKEMWEGIWGFGKTESMDSQVADLNKWIANAEDLAASGDSRGTNRMAQAELAAKRAELANLMEMKRFQNRASASVSENARSGKSEIQKMLDEYNASKNKPSAGSKAMSEADRYMESLTQQLQTVKQLTVEEQLREELTTGRLSKEKIDPKKREELLALARQIDTTKEFAEIDAEFDKARSDSAKAREKELDDRTRKTQQWYSETRTALEVLQAKESEYDAARKQGLIDEELLIRLKAKANAEYQQSLDKSGKDAIEQARRLGDAYANTFSSALQGGMKFADLLKKLAIDTISIQFLTPWAQGAGKSLASGIGKLFSGKSYDGGGYTGNGARSGGMDGKGGYLAMLHPRETVLDHTKGQGMVSAGASITQNITIDARGADAGVEARIRAAMEQSKRETLAEVQARANRGGSFARSMGRA